MNTLNELINKYDPDVVFKAFKLGIEYHHKQMPSVEGFFVETKSGEQGVHFIERVDNIQHGDRVLVMIKKIG